MVIVIGNGHGDMSSNPGRDRLHCVISCPSGGIGKYNQYNHISFTDY